jgi:hypothetical protein
LHLLHTSRFTVASANFIDHCLLWKREMLQRNIDAPCTAAVCRRACPHVAPPGLGHHGWSRSIFGGQKLLTPSGWQPIGAMPIFCRCSCSSRSRNAAVIHVDALARGEYRPLRTLTAGS